LRNLSTNCLLLSLLLTSFVSYGQAEVVNNTKTAIKSGSSKELSKLFNEMVELSFDGNKASYSRTQAEFVMKDFFKRNIPVDFQYVHQGKSKEGLQYAIGKYNTAESNYRVVIYIKQFNGNYLIDLLDFNKE